MSNFNRRVLSWLDSVPDAWSFADTQEDAHNRKRPHPNSRTPLSPPPSQDHETSPAVDMLPATPSRKRRRLLGGSALGAHASRADDDDENDETPTQPSRGAAQSLRDSDTSSFSCESSHASNNSSPSKMLSSLSLYPTGVEQKQLDLDDPNVPDALAELCNQMDTISNGSRVVPGYLESEISELKTSTRTFALFHPGVFDRIADDLVASGSGVGVASKTLPGMHHKLELDEVLQLVGDAKDCQDMEDDEAGWNNLVHTPLLRIVFYGKSPRGRQLDGFRPCTSASILPGYRISNAQGKKVDYVFHLDPSKDDNQPATTEAVTNLRRTLTDTSVNHISYAPLRALPVSVSIESKRSGESERRAQLQMGVWQAAQWKHLLTLAGDDLLKLSFIPGILIQGHEWKFVASTFHNGKTTLWTGDTFGSTKKPLTTFQAIAGVRRLRVWALDVFWPWYKAHVLKVSTSSPSPPST